MANALSLATKSPASRRRRNTRKKASGTSALAKAQNQIARMKNAANKADAKAGHAVKVIVDNALVAGGAYAAAYVGAKPPMGLPAEIAGVDTRLGLAAGLIVFGAYSPMMGKKENYVHGVAGKIGTGMLAGVAYEMGHNMALGSGAPTGAKTARFSGAHMNGAHMGRDVYVSGLSGR